MKKIIERYSESPINLFKTIFITFLFAYMPFAILQIIFNLLKIIPVVFNDAELFGFTAILIILLYMPLIVLILSCSAWLYFMIGILFLKFIKYLFYEK
jgi:hypothetical protein